MITTEKIEHREFTFPIYCHECKKHYQIKLTENPEPICCPNKHSLGTWSYEGTKQIVCRTCVDKFFMMHNRKRHDIVSPKGRPIIVIGTKDENEEILNHFAEKHPQALREFSRETGIKINNK